MSTLIVNHGASNRAIHTPAAFVPAGSEIFGEKKNNTALFPPVSGKTNQKDFSFLHLEPKSHEEKALQEFAIGSDVDSEVHNQTIIASMREILLFSDDVELKGQVFHHMVNSMDRESLNPSVRDDLYNMREALNSIRAFVDLHLNGLDFRGKNLSCLDLTNVQLNKANLANADISGTILIGAKLFNADLSYANLSAANLTDAQLNDAKIAGANFTNAHVDGTSFIGVDVDRGQLKGAKNPRMAILLENLYHVPKQGNSNIE